jgi:hypothetical protein
VYALYLNEIGYKVMFSFDKCNRVWMLRNSIDMAIGLEIWLLIPKWGVNGPEVTK